MFLLILRNVEIVSVVSATVSENNQAILNRERN